MLGQLGDMYKLQREAKKIKKELSNTHIYAEVSNVKVTVTGEQEVVSVEFLDGAPTDNMGKLGKAIVEATNKAIKKSQAIAAEKMKAIMSGM